MIFLPVVWSQRGIRFRESWRIFCSWADRSTNRPWRRDPGVYPSALFAPSLHCVRSPDPNERPNNWLRDALNRNFFAFLGFFRISGQLKHAQWLQILMNLDAPELELSWNGSFKDSDSNGINLAQSDEFDRLTETKRERERKKERKVTDPSGIMTGK